MGAVVKEHSRRSFLASAATVFLASSAARSQDTLSQSKPADSDTIFSSSVQVVNMLATVRTKKNEIVRDLNKDDFTVLEDNRPQTIQYFSRDTDLPLTLGLLVDTSLSQTHVLDAERGASFRFLDEVLRENKDHVFIMQFDVTVQTREPLTSSRRDLDKALSYVDTPSRNTLRSAFGGGGTLLFDAVVDASQDIMKKQTGRKALLILSDGGENGSDATLAEAIEAAQRAETLIYSILYSDGSYSNGGRRTMERLADETGGSYFEVTKKLSIDDVFTLIQEDLRSQYSIGFVSDRPAEFSQLRHLQLTVKRPGLVIRTRDRYWAGPKD